GGGRLRDRSHGESRPYHAARGGLPGRSLAPDRLASLAETGGDQVGIGRDALLTFKDSRAVFLDRDGVVNEAMVRDGRPYQPPSAADLRIVEGASESLARLKQLGFLLLVVTNQPDVARGAQT